jgi:5-methylcytosine-specific restriction endonuclease McrA
LESTSEKPVPHGTHGGYTHHKCRCEECKAAMSAYKKAYREKNREKLILQDRAYYAGNRVAMCEAQRARYAKDAEGNRSYARQRYSENAPERIAKTMEWSRANQSSRQSYRTKRKALARKAGILPVTGRDWSRVQQRFNHCCAYCGQRAKLTQDHVVPISRGGWHAIGNIVPACGSCNSSKGNRLLVEWRR